PTRSDHAEPGHIAAAGAPHQPRLMGAVASRARHARRRGYGERPRAVPADGDRSPAGHPSPRRCRLFPPPPDPPAANGAGHGGLRTLGAPQTRPHSAPGTEDWAPWTVQGCGRMPPRRGWRMVSAGWSTGYGAMQRSAVLGLAGFTAVSLISCWR